MNRLDEYRELMAGLEAAPPEMEDTLSRARRRLRKRRANLFGVPVGGLAAALCTFILLVNASTTFAYAMGRVPVLGTLAKAVAFSPSLKAAVDNQYVQPMTVSQSKMGVTLKVEYIIVDRKQVNVFFSVKADDGSELRADSQLRPEHNPGLEGYATHGSYPGDKNDLYHFVVDFFDSDVPEQIVMSTGVLKVDRQRSEPIPVGDHAFDFPPYEEPEYLAEFDVELVFDPMFTESGYVYPIGSWVDIGGQQIYLESLDIYPTHVRLNLEDHPDNTAYLTSLELSIMDDKGQVVEKIKNGITASGSADTPFVRSHRLESNYFSSNRSLRLLITKATFLDKAHETIRLDLDSGIADYLPEDVEIASVERKEKGWTVCYRVKEQKPDHTHSVFHTAFYDPEGREYDTLGYSTLFDETGEGYFIIRFDYPYTGDVILIKPQYTHTVTLDGAIEAAVSIPVEIDS